MLQWNAELTNQWVTDRYLPLVAENESILDLLKVLARRGADAVIRGGGDRSMRTALAAAKSGIPEAHRLSPSGYLPIEHADVQQVREDLREHLSFVRSNTPEISSENLAALRGILNVAERNDIDLTLVFAPVAEDLARDDRFQAYYLGIRKLLEREVRGKHTSNRSRPAPHLPCHADAERRSPGAVRGALIELEYHPRHPARRIEW